MWLLVPLFALAQASCYDYEYYDPTTGSSLPGNACAKAGATATTGQPVAAAPVVGATTFSGSLATAPVVGATTYSAAPVYGTPLAAAPAAPVYGTPVYGTPIVSSSIYGTPITTTVAASAPIYGTPIATTAITARTVATPIYGTTTVAAARPAAAVTVSAGAARGAAPQVGANGQTQLSKQQVQYYKQLGEEQQRDHKYNQRVVKQANDQLTRSSLVNTIIAGSGNIAPWYPLYRLGQQKKISNAFQDEVRIANRNADDAYDRFKQNPTRLNMLVSKYQDFNADLREAASHYNNVNTGTFGQRLTNTGIFGTGSSLVNIISQTVVQRQEVEDLQDIQEDMNRIARQIQGEVKRLQGGSATASASANANAQTGQGSVPQRMMAMSVYGPRG